MCHIHWVGGLISDIIICTLKRGIRVFTPDSGFILISILFIHMQGKDIKCSDIQESKAFCPYMSPRTQRKYARLRNQHSNLKSTSPWIWIRKNGEPEACCACVSCVEFNKDFGIYQRRRGFHSIPVKVTLPRHGNFQSPLNDVTVGCTCVPNH